MPNPFPLAALGLILCVPLGCGPLTVPAVHRLSPEEQAEVNGMWDNMLTPPHRLPRDVLVDAVMVFQLYQSGVDRLSMRSEKSFAGGAAVMTIQFDRLQPTQDAFTIEIWDRTGQKVRTERYTSDEVFERLRNLYGTSDIALETATTRPSTAPATSPAPATLPSKRALQHAALIERIQAATQPAN
jgi:hypothetical protein